MKIFSIEDEVSEKYLKKYHAKKGKYLRKENFEKGNLIGWKKVLFTSSVSTPRYPTTQMLFS